jgi:hypothetical protein
MEKPETPPKEPPAHFRAQQRDRHWDTQNVDIFAIQILMSTDDGPIQDRIHEKNAIHARGSD